MKKPLSLILFFFILHFSSAQCLLEELSLEQKAVTASDIVEGKIIAKKSYWNLDKSSIFTVYTLEIYSILKNSTLTSNQVDVMIPGGEIDEMQLTVEPNVTLEIGNKNLFFLNKTQSRLENYPNLFIYEIYGLNQGVIHYDNFSNIYETPFKNYKTKDEILSQLKSITHQESIIIKEDKNENKNAALRISAPSITSISPTTITAGTNSILTINGSGFGSTQTGSATVQFRDANSIVSTTYASIPSSLFISSWSNTKIDVIVPGYTSGVGGAGNGFVRVLDASGNIATSSTPLTVTYNQSNDNLSRYCISNLNTLGGYTFTLNSSLDANTNAKNAFLRAIDNWKCATRVNLTVGSTTSSNTCNSSDGVNLISFASSSCTLPAGILGLTYTYSSICTSPTKKNVITEIDMILSNTANWNFLTSNASSTQADFESTVLHELGHGIGQGHVSLSSEVMYPLLQSGATRRVLNTLSDIENENDILSRSTIGNNCSKAAHILAPSCATAIENKNSIFENISIFPNPSSSIINIELNLKEKTSLLFKLIDVTGNIIYNEIDNSSKNSYTKTIDISTLANGIYFLEISTNNEKSMAKINVIH